MSDGQPTLCQKGGEGGIFFPLFGDAETELPLLVRQILYLLGLLWFFGGVAIVSDSFMQGIESITSQTQEITTPDGETRRVAIWNDTIANLTLMALGSSAPEILLSMIEVFSRRMFSGDLGPSTIVGSAAFNLFIITAICIGSLPAGEVRLIKDLDVYAVTTVFSLFAYIWMYIILAISSPDLIEPWEGIVTFAMFPCLLLCAFAADRNWVRGGSASNAWSALPPEQIAQIRSDIEQSSSKQISEQKIVQFIQVSMQAAERKSLARMRYRCRTIRNMTASKRRGPTSIGNACRSRRGSRLGSAADYIREFLYPSATLTFSQGLFVVIECMKQVKVTVARQGATSSAVKVDYCTRDGTAEAGSDYIAKTGVIEFARGEVEKSIFIDIIDDDAVEPDEDFCVILSNPRSDNPRHERAELGAVPQARVLIIDDDDPGVLRFESAEVTLYPAEGTQDLVVRREGGVRGKITCQYRMENVDETKGSNDYVPATGELVFEEDVILQTVPLTILNCVRAESKFLVILENIEGSRVPDKATGSSLQEICTVTIRSKPQEESGTLDWNAFSHQDSWSDQLTSAIYVNGCKEEQALASRLDWVTHVITVPWKVIAASIPPPKHCHGWLCFFTSLVVLAFITALINDFAIFFGCVSNIPKYITAITLVALGTSLPDTFASMAAAKHDPYADASIGNITGSNSVNIYLGIGLPWGSAAVYWSLVGRTDEWEKQCCAMKPSLLTKYDKGFIVIADSLWITVAAFLVCAVFAIALLALRRVKCGGELGGPRKWRLGSIFAMVMLWVVYIFISSAAAFL